MNQQLIRPASYQPTIDNRGMLFWNPSIHPRKLSRMNTRGGRVFFRMLSKLSVLERECGRG
jgi:hypothetical protein